MDFTTLLNSPLSSPPRSYSPNWPDTPSDAAAPQSPRVQDAPVSPQVAADWGSKGTPTQLANADAEWEDSLQRNEMQVAGLPSEYPGELTFEFASASDERDGPGEVENDELESSEDEIVEAEQEEGASRSGATWKGWEDRLLLREVVSQGIMEEDATGRSEERFQMVAEALTEHQNINRSANSCRARLISMRKEHEQDCEKSKRATGTVEEHNQMVKDLDYLVSLHNDKKTRPRRKRSEKEDMARKKQEGDRIVEASMQNLAAKRGLAGSGGGSKKPKRIRLDLDTITTEVNESLRELEESKENFDELLTGIKDDLEESDRRAEALYKNNRKVLKEQQALNERMESIDENGKKTNALLQQLVEAQIWSVTK